MSFFKKYSYIIVKLFLNQFAISLFGIGLAFASSYSKNNTLLLVSSIFSVIFYLFLEYAPPYWVMMILARAGLGFLILTGYCSCFS